MQQQERKWGVATTVYTALVTRSLADYKANPTLASGDAKISKDGGATANLATLPDAEPDSGRAIRVQLSATEMECSTATIQFVDQTATKEWEDQIIIIETQKARGVITGKVVSDGSNSATTFDTGLTQSATDHFKGCWVTFNSGALTGQTVLCTAFTPATDFITVASPGFTATPTAGDIFEIVGGG